jgi:hypothetical protein
LARALIIGEALAVVVLAAAAGSLARRRRPVHSPDRTPIDDFLSKLKPVSYDYKQPEVDGEGRQYGVMAQDMERSPMGASMVEETPRGKMVDTRKAAMGSLASLADHHDRIGRMEQAIAHLVRGR